MSGLSLPGPKRAADLGVVTCAARGCDSKGLALPLLDDRGQVEPGPPAGWSMIAALDAKAGVELALFVCSPACQRRLAMTLTTPRRGSLSG